MHGEIKDWNNGWYGVSLGVSQAEIDRLIALLTALRNNPDQHFHISSDYVDSGGIGDIEMYVNDADAVNNLRVSGIALPPGDSIP